MLPTKSFAALSATTPLEAYSFNRRAVGAKDVQIEILYCGVCHSDLHQAKDEWGVPYIQWCQVMKLLEK